MIIAGGCVTLPGALFSLVFSRGEAEDDKF